MTAPVYPESPDWLAEDDWSRLLEHVARNKRIDSQTALAGLIGSDASSVQRSSPQDIWWEAWQIAVIQSGEAARELITPCLTSKAEQAATKPRDARRGRGRPGNKTIRIMEFMKAMDAADLENMKGEEMVARFSELLGETVVRDTCERARKRVQETH